MPAHAAHNPQSFPVCLSHSQQNWASSWLRRFKREVTFFYLTVRWVCGSQRSFSKKKQCLSLKKAHCGAVLFIGIKAMRRRWTKLGRNGSSKYTKLPGSPGMQPCCRCFTKPEIGSVDLIWSYSDAAWEGITLDGTSWYPKDTRICPLPLWFDLPIRSDASGQNKRNMKGKLWKRNPNNT